ncbi:TIR domain-containing protein [Curvivirga sp.]|uniref:TIR domain-containing protein n=1 Tax=Curvivirga sp. TaxID=2856848 RepID=UPI003B5BDCC1
MKKVSIFITHAWRFHNDWNLLTSMMENIKETPWINYSVPWYDPAISTHTETGKLALKNMLFTQILPAEAVVFLEEPYQSKSSREWIDYEIEQARKLGKKIIALPDSQTLSYQGLLDGSDVFPMVWDLNQIRQEIQKV